jgi:micrococcal nuclease
MFVHNAIHFTLANRKCSIPPDASTNFVVSTVCDTSFSRVISNSIKNASRRRFLVIATGFILALFNLPVYTNTNPLCPAKQVGTKVRIAHVIDGDTVVLASGDRLRLIGIDTPEISYKGNASQIRAIDARDFLKAITSSSYLYSLDYGVERQDRHGRMLGHLFRNDGTNLQAMLLAQGYATPLNIPPNINYADCYAQQTRQAQKARLGVWKLPRNQAISSSALSGKERGYRIVYGRVARISQGPYDISFYLSQRLVVRIALSDLQYFPNLNTEGLLG